MMEGDPRGDQHAHYVGSQMGSLSYSQRNVYAKHPNYGLEIR